MSIMMSNPVNTSAAPAAQGTAVQAAATSSAAGTQTAAPAAPFAQWLGRQADGADGLPLAPPAAPAATLPAGFAATLQADASPDTVTAAAAPAADTAPAADDGDSATAAANPDNTLLAAMAMPLMPLTPMQIAQAVHGAQGGMSGAGAGGSGDAKVPAGPSSGSDIRIGGAGRDGGRRAGIALPNVETAQAAAPATSAASARQDDAGVRLAVQAPGAKAGGNSTPQFDTGTQDGDSATPGTTSAAVPVPAATPSAGAPAADSVKLAGPPTAWRQSLQEALGDRLQVQVGKNVEQAVIRLEPPQLGRIDIAIRHSNGTLEVNISATNGEVLRQLQTVSDNLRNDLAQRQYLDVSVSVAAAPKSGAATPGDAQQNMQQQQQHRGRQPGREQDEPGRALAEASGAASAFSLGARDA